MSKKPKTILRALERSHAAAEAHSKEIRSAIGMAGLINHEAAEAHLSGLEEYLAANQKLQALINLVYGKDVTGIALQAKEHAQLARN